MSQESLEELDESIKQTKKELEDLRKANEAFAITVKGKSKRYSNSTFKIRNL